MIVVYTEYTVSAKAIMILIFLIIIQIGQYYDNPFLMTTLNKMEFESFFSMFSILLLTLYSYAMQNDNLSIFLIIVTLVLYLRFLYISLRHLALIHLKKLFENKKFRNSPVHTKLKSLFENTKICKNDIVYIYLTFYFNS